MHISLNMVMCGQHISHLFDIAPWQHGGTGWYLSLCHFVWFSIITHNCFSRLVPRKYNVPRSTKKFTFLAGWFSKTSAWLCKGTCFQCNEPVLCLDKKNYEYRQVNRALTCNYRAIYGKIHIITLKWFNLWVYILSLEKWPALCTEQF